MYMTSKCVYLHNLLDIVGVMTVLLEMDVIGRVKCKVGITEKNQTLNYMNGLYEIVRMNYIVRDTNLL